METEDFLPSKIFKATVAGIGAFLIISLAFSLGVYVGQERANFSFEWADAYHRNFGGPAEGFLGKIAATDFINANGVFGQIIKTNFTPSQTIFTIKGADGVEKIIWANSRTSVRTQRKNIKLSELKIDDFVVIIGNPAKEGQIFADLIRVMPRIFKGNDRLPPASSLQQN